MSTFAVFSKEMPNRENIFEVKQVKEEHSSYGRLLCVYVEKSVISTRIEHIYAASIDKRTGDIYIDDSQRKILCKNTALILARPLHTLIKTIWHLTFIPVGVEVYRCASSKQSKKTTAYHSVQHILDIIRTPVYGTAMTCAHLFGTVIGLLHPSSILETRRLIGKLERLQNRIKGTEQSAWTLSRCFSPLANIASIHLYAPKRDKRQAKRPKLKRIQEGLSSFARTQVKFLQKTVVIAHGCKVLADGEAYRSSTLNEEFLTPHSEKVVPYKEIAA